MASRFADRADRKTQGLQYLVLRNDSSVRSFLPLRMQEHEVTAVAPNATEVLQRQLLEQEIATLKLHRQLEAQQQEDRKKQALQSVVLANDLSVRASLSQRMQREATAVVAPYAAAAAPSISMPTSLLMTMNSSSNRTDMMLSNHRPLPSTTMDSSICSAHPHPHDVEPFFDVDDVMHPTFPYKLYAMLMQCEERRLQHIVEFVEDGTAFVVHKPW